MQTIRTSRPSVNGTAVSRTVLSVVRILIASYFLATATGLILEPSSRNFLDAVLNAHDAALATTVYLFVTAFMIMVGKAVRPAALLLAVYIFWSGFVHYKLGGSPEALASFWRDMALLGAVLLIAVTEPGGSGKFQLWHKPVAPRRIVPQQMADRIERTATPRPTRTQEQMLRDTIFGNDLFADTDADDLDEDDDDDALGNLFADLWETSTPGTLPVPVRVTA